MKRYQPEKYEAWMEGKDYGCHPEDPQRLSNAPLPQNIYEDDDDEEPTPRKCLLCLLFSLVC